MKGKKKEENKKKKKRMMVLLRYLRSECRTRFPIFHNSPFRNVIKAAKLLGQNGPSEDEVRKNGENCENVTLLTNLRVHPEPNSLLAGPSGHRLCNEKTPSQTHGLS